MFNSVTYNSLISYECNYGYMIIGETVRRCERNKVWTGLQPICRGNTLLTLVISHTKCIEINCGSPGILPNGWLEGSRTTLHAVVTFRWESEYVWCIHTWYVQVSGRNDILWSIIPDHMSGRWEVESPHTKVLWWAFVISDHVLSNIMSSSLCGSSYFSWICGWQGKWINYRYL